MSPRLLKRRGSLGSLAVSPKSILAAFEQALREPFGQSGRQDLASRLFDIVGSTPEREYGQRR